MIKKSETIDNDDGLTRYSLPLTKEQINHLNDIGFLVKSIGRDGRKYVYKLTKMIK